MDNKKKVAAAVAATIAASGVAVDASFDNPADILQQDVNTQPQIQYVDLENDQDTGAAQDEDKQKDPAVKAGPVQEWILHLPLAVRAVFVLPLWFAGHLLVMGGNLLFAGLSPILQYLLSFVLIALVIAAAFTAAAKAMFPDLPIGKILNRHSIKWILIAAAAAWLADLLLGIFWSGYAHVKSILLGVFTLLSIGSVVLWFARREHRRLASLCIQPEAVCEEPETLEYTSLGQTFTIRPDRERDEK
ncbi:MAG: hypothetical protein IJ109_03720 [Firmicutes bacterium]|nr:hypothetical protein [Bacillota bacterium]